MTRRGRKYTEAARLVEPERQRLLVRYGIGRFAASAGRSLHSGINVRRVGHWYRSPYGPGRGVDDSPSRCSC